jgi:predicted HicB family RNase H-like nuclease
MPNRNRTSPRRRALYSVAVIPRPKREIARLNLRISPQLKQALEAEALAAGLTLSAFIKSTLARALRRKK